MAGITQSGMTLWQKWHYDRNDTGRHGIEAEMAL